MEAGFEPRPAYASNERKRHAPGICIAGISTTSLPVQHSAAALHSPNTAKNYLSMEAFWQQLESQLQQQIGTDFRIRHHQAIGGGCISNAVRIDGNDRKQSFFVKYHHKAADGMFAAEYRGLQVLQQANAICIPQPICYGDAAGVQYLCMEYIPLQALDSHSLPKLGEQLAKLHRQTSDQFGWEMDNWIGSTPQKNSFKKNWIAFWKEERFEFQLDLAKHNQCKTSLLDKGNHLLQQIEAFFDQHQPMPSLLHGDCWSGNCASDANGNPVLFDPAIYYGDREADLAMTELFGGFSQSFYQAYQQTYPLDAGYEDRKLLYNLYHILNHFNIFGGGYGAQSECIIDTLLQRLK